ncbi:alternative ribosome rescue aminoacyl-tRNA hydrolase ArfB [Microbulbifer halophilus]|uniref:Alternative ribosome rescue aminoacyl-tRNA hydrolase ArfB n=1 Tax=Microbulbifer halophilus TaxID=453963 RepID=A0ABW5E904_9GAMM|nr:alternative ribosome rescue aminoacyl-tRNA hydrolase ArfB [Microbulbifer halophilus]MCW8127282.1 alternative ribosome rescue aminoacyl-tRNA hydrolase ArfB [Microbulbifer halophilus]
MLKISNRLAVPLAEIDMSAVRAQGAGGQNVNKVSSAIHLRFDIRASSLPEEIKQRLLQRGDQRISADGVVVIKAQRFRTREKNREDALERLRALLQTATRRRKKRIPTKPTRGSKERRLKQKTQRGRIKSLRGKVRE